MRDIAELRAEIDCIDSKIVELIEKRMCVSKQVGDFKQSKGLPVFDPQREEQVIQSRTELLNDKSLSSDVEQIFKLIMKLSREKQVR